MADRGPGPQKPAEQPAGEQRQMRVGIDERNMTTSYANFFRTNGTPEEVMVDFGVNVANTAAGQPNQPDVVVILNHRIVLNYFSAKRLVLTLGQMITRHEEQFGTLELDVAKRAKSK